MKNKFPFFLWIFILLSAGLSAQNIVTEDNFEVMVNNCNDQAMVCIDIPLENLQDYTITKDGEAYSGPVSGCDFDTLVNYNYNTLFGQGNQGPYMLDQWMVDGTIFSGQFTDIPDLVAMMNDWDPAGEWEHSAPELSIIGGAAGSTYSMMSITVMSNSTPALMGFNFNIISQGITLQFPTGEHNINVVDNNSNASDDFTVVVSCQPTNNTINVQLYEGQSEEVCLDFSELINGEMSQVMAACSPDNNEIADFGLVNAGTCVEVAANSAGQEVACFIAVDANGNQDTTFVEVMVLPLSTTPFYYDDEIPANQEVYQICLDTMELPGNVVSISNYCPEESGDFVSFTLDPETYCVKYAGLDCDGTENACIIICDDLAICDTTFISITVDNTVCQPQPEYINNTIYQGQSLLYCFNADDLPGDLVSIENVCEGTGNVDFMLDENNYCVDYEGLEVGEDNACVVVTDNFGNTDTTYFTINVITPASEIIEATLILGEEENFCLSTEELPGDSYTIFNDCEESSGENVLFNINNVSLCIETTALSIGTDTACIIVCDENLICDTTYYYITVEEDDQSGNNNLPPIAVDDDLSTSENSPLVMNVLGNDTIPLGSQIVVYVLPEAGGGIGPQNGTTEVNQDGTITYTPDNGFCGADSINYVLCNQFGCDTALVSIKVECINTENAEIVVHNGFSPNGDNINDTFVVSGLENYSRNTVKIFNRWGTTVFATESYRNTWDGTWDGKVIPDGTYFYMIEVEDVGNYNGYLEIRR